METILKKVGTRTYQVLLTILLMLHVLKLYGAPVPQKDYIGFSVVVLFLWLVFYLVMDRINNNDDVTLS
jgi:hypothetical protein